MIDLLAESSTCKDCSASCQRLHWPSHKPVCNRALPSADAAPELGAASGGAAFAAASATAKADFHSTSSIAPDIDGIGQKELHAMAHHLTAKGHAFHDGVLGSGTAKIVFDAVKSLYHTHSSSFETGLVGGGSSGTDGFAYNNKIARGDRVKHMAEADANAAGLGPVLEFASLLLQTLAANVPEL